MTIENHGKKKKTGVRVRQDHKIEEKTEAENESMPGAYHTVWFLRSKPPAPAPAYQQLSQWAWGLQEGWSRRSESWTQRKKECKDPSRAFLDNSCLALWTNMALEKIKVREENQFSQNLLGQSCHLKVSEVPRKVTLQERELP